MNLEPYQPSSTVSSALPSRSSSTGPLSLLTRPLGLEGWEEVEPVLLAALASEEPILLIGPHGSAKSFLLERLARALSLDYRFYNASLINYDDLVGIPMPDESRKNLTYISTASSIWGAEVVFFDEINRTRPELQNKLFPIIHERRVQGIPLDKLRFRWAAMNPPPAMEPADDSLETYFGTEPLDPALADRFSFIVIVPSWKELTRDQRKRVLRDQYSGPHPFRVEPLGLIERTRETFMAFQKTPPSALSDYLLCLLDHLEKAKITFSTRRATMLHRNMLSIHAARKAIARLVPENRGSIEPEWATSAILALVNSLPQIAQGREIDRSAILAAHRHAWEVANLDATDPWRELLQIKSPRDRCVKALQMKGRVDDDRLSDLVLDALSHEPDDTARTIFSLVVYAAVYRTRDVRATVYETMARYLQNVLKTGDYHLPDGPVTKHKAVERLIESFTKGADGKVCIRDRYAANLLNGLFPQGFGDKYPKQVYENYRSLWDKVFGGEQEREEAR